MNLFFYPTSSRSYLTIYALYNLLNRVDFRKSIIFNAVEHYLRAVAEDVRDVHITLNENRKRLEEIGDSTREWRQQFRELKLSHEQDKIIRWLEYTDPSTNHNAVCELHEPSTGNWLLQSDDFAKWKRESKQFPAAAKLYFLLQS